MPDLPQYSDEELLRLIIRGRRVSKYSYETLAQKYNISVQKAKELYEPYKGRTGRKTESDRERLSAAVVATLSDKEKEIRGKRKVFKNDLIPFPEMSLKLNVAEEELRRIGYGIPWGNKPKVTASKEGGKMPHEPKLIRTDILKRFMKEEDLQRLITSYRQNKRGKGNIDRKALFELPIPKQDIELLKLYVTEFEITLDEIARNNNTTRGQFYSKVLRTAVNVVYKHPEVLDQLLSEENNITEVDK